MVTKTLTNLFALEIKRGFLQWWDGQEWTTVKALVSDDAKYQAHYLCMKSEYRIVDRDVIYHHEL